MPAKKKKAKIATYAHPADTRRNIPTAEVEPAMDKDKRKPITLEYERASRNTNLDPQLLWRGKDEQDQTDLVVTSPPIFIQEKVHPRVLVEDLIRASTKAKGSEEEQLDLFSDFNGLEDPNLKGDYYEHEQNWSNRMILGDSLQVMASLNSREGYQEKVQCIYMDPPYGIRFNSNFQWSTTSHDVKDGNVAHITREPEQVKAFRDTWRDGIHSYLTYLRDRLTVARDLLTDSGSIFVQIGDENVHRVRALMDEVFGENNFISQISFAKTSGYATNFLTGVCDYILWYGKNRETTKFRQPLNKKEAGESGATKYNRIRLSDFRIRPMTSGERFDPSTIPAGAKIWVDDNLTSQGNPQFAFSCNGREFSGTYKTTPLGMTRLWKASRIYIAQGSLRFIRFIDDFSTYPASAAWMDIGGVQSRTDPKVYVVQTSTEAIKRCILMTTDPGDLALDPTCGSGTTAQVAEQWGRRWITIDTSRVALALARARIMGARYPYYILADSRDGQLKEAHISHRALSEVPTYDNVRQGFVYERVPHITLRDIANNAEIDIIYEEYQEKLEPLREDLNRALETTWREWEIPRESGDPWPEAAAAAWLTARGPDNTDADKATALRVLNMELGRNYTLDDVPDQPRDPWKPEADELHRQWWELRIARQREIDASIAARAEYEYLYDKPYEDRNKVRVAGPFTVESISPHRLLVSGDEDETNETPTGKQSKNGHHYEGTAPDRDFASMIIENLRTAGVQQANKSDKIEFNSIVGWPGEYICAEAEYTEGESEKRAGIFVGPEFGTVGQPDLNAAAREAARAGFDVLISCAFSYDAHATELNRLGALPILKARMNADLHMDTDLKNTGQGNLFVIFGEPDITLEEGEKDQLRVRIKGVDIYDPSTGQVRSDDTDGIACWFIDTDYNEESFFVRHAYFLGANDPYKALKTTLNTEIDKEAWESLNSDVSRPFPKPESGRIAVKVINHLGDEAMKVIRMQDM